MVDVECDAGFRGEQALRRFSLGTRHVEVAEVLDRWVGTEHRYFRVRGDDDRVYLLRQDPALGPGSRPFSQEDPEARHPSVVDL